MALPAQADTDNKLLQKITINTNSLTSGGSGAASNVSITGVSVTLPVSGPLTDAQLRASAISVTGPLTDTQLRATPVPVSGTVATGGLTDTQLRATAVPVSGTVTATGPLTDTQLRASAVPISAASLPLPTGAALESSLSSLNGKVTAVNTGAVVIASGTTVVTQSTAANLLVTATLPASTTAIGNVGGKTTAIKDTTAVSTTPAYSIGDAVGGKRTIANALTAAGTGVLESITVLDRANQSAPLTIIIFDADPTNATITDNAAFVYSTDDLKVLGQINIAATDYTTLNSKAVATIKGIGLTLKAAGTSLYVAVVTSSTPTYAATTDVQIILGILQD